MVFRRRLIPLSFSSLVIGFIFTVLVFTLLFHDTTFFSSIFIFVFEKRDILLLLLNSIDERERERHDVGREARRSLCHGWRS